MTHRISRRAFLKATAVTAAGFPLFHIGKAGAAPSAMVNHASFGAAGMALADLQSLARSPYFNLVAVAEVDERRLAEVRQLFPQAKVYRDWRVLLEEEGGKLDSVNVSTPDHMHASMSVAAMNRGLHVYCQKPMAHNLYENRRMTEIATRRGLVTQMGVQLSSGMHERLMARMIQDGVIGEVREVHIFSNKLWGDPHPLPDRSDPVPPELDWDGWCGASAKRPYLESYYHPGEWRKRTDYGTGTLGDMGCHIFSPMFQALQLKRALSVTYTGTASTRDNWALHGQCEYVFAGTRYTDGRTLKAVWYDGHRRPPAEVQALVGGTLPDQGGVYIGTEGVMLYPHEAAPRLFPEEQFKDYRHPRLEARNHYIEFLDAVRGEDVQPVADFAAYAAPLTEAVLLGTLSSHFPEETLTWNSRRLRFRGHAAASELVRRDYRAGWDVPGL